MEMRKGLTGVFEISSVLKVSALCILTLGGYLIYKLYCFSNQINQHTEHKISKIFIFISIFLYSISFCYLIYGLVNLHDLTILTNSVESHIISSFFDVTWIVMVRNRINLITGSNKGDRLWLHPFKASILHVIYMQYKINQGLTKNAI